MTRLAASILGALCTVAGAGSPPAEPAEALVRSMRLDEFAARIANFEARAAVQGTRASSRKSDCIVPIAPAKLADDLSRAVPKMLSREEIAAANAFYATSMGAKVVEHTFLQIEHQLAGAGEEPPQPPTTPEEAEILQAFAQTSAWRKLVEGGFLLNTPPVERVVDGAVRGALVRCRGAVRTTPQDIVPKKIESPLEREPQAD